MVRAGAPRWGAPGLTWGACPQDGRVEGGVVTAGWGLGMEEPGQQRESRRRDEVRLVGGITLWAAAHRSRPHLS